MICEDGFFTGHHPRALSYARTVCELILQTAGAYSLRARVILHPYLRCQVAFNIMAVVVLETLAPASDIVNDQRLVNERMHEDHTERRAQIQVLALCMD